MDDAEATLGIMRDLYRTVANVSQQNRELATECQRLQAELATFNEPVSDDESDTEDE